MAPTSKEPIFEGSTYQKPVSRKPTSGKLYSGELTLLEPISKELTSGEPFF